MKLSLNDEMIHEVYTRSEGWFVGLQLLALTLHENPLIRESAQSLSDPNRNIHEYLLNEVLRRLPASVQTFLLRTSHLQSFNASLCDAVLDQMDSKDILQYLLRANVFVMCFSCVVPTPGYEYRQHDER